MGAFCNDIGVSLSGLILLARLKAVEAGVVPGSKLLYGRWSVGCTARGKLLPE